MSNEKGATTPLINPQTSSPGAGTPHPHRQTFPPDSQPHRHNSEIATAYPLRNVTNSQNSAKI